ncbi:hypothetical protein, partial [Escherichia coli]
MKKKREMDVTVETIKKGRTVVA